MEDSHDDLKRTLRTVKRLLETAEAEDAAPNLEKAALFDTVSQLVVEVEKLIGGSARGQTAASQDQSAASAAWVKRTGRSS